MKNFVTPASQNAQADLNLRWVHMSEDTFSDVADKMQFILVKKIIISDRHQPFRF